MSVVRKEPVSQPVDAAQPWRGFNDAGGWQDAVDVRAFIQANFHPYDGDASFLAPPTPRTERLLAKVTALLEEESAKGGVLDIDTEHVSGIATAPPGYIDQGQEVIVGLQTDAPLKRAVNPYGGVRMAQQACEAYGHTMDPRMVEVFSKYRVTHNEGVFRLYTKEMRAARRTGVITGLPDAYGRGRIIGDYRRVALYGVDHLIAAKEADRIRLAEAPMLADSMQLLEEVFEQIESLKELKQMGSAYGFDLSRPAVNALEAVQWTYFGYLAAIKEQNGAAMSLGRVSTFFDVYFERDFEEGTLTEAEAQEIFDDFVLKLRLGRQLRTPDYNELFAGDPTWTTEVLAGVSEDGRHMVTKSTYRMLHTLYNLGAAPEPNLTVLWSQMLPESFKHYCAKVSIDTTAIQYENDDLMRPGYGDDYGIACCVSAMKLGQQMQFFGARCNLPKVLLMALNGGRDEVSGEQVGPERAPVQEGILDYDDVVERFSFYRDWLCKLYVNTMNVIHRSHDKYSYERIEMALHDSEVERLMAFGIAGLSVCADSLSAIRHARVRPVTDERGLVVDFDCEGDFPAFGNDDNRVDSIAVEIVRGFSESLRKNPTYRGALHTVSILTITSNVVYGKKTGSTPCGRKQGEPFAPGANPMHNRDVRGGIASLNSVAKLPYDACQDGISCTFSVTPHGLGPSAEARPANLSSILDGYFTQTGQHININVLNRDQLIEAMDHPSRYPNLTVRVSGYAVNFNRLSRKHQQEIIDRTFHEKL